LRAMIVWQIKSRSVEGCHSKFKLVGGQLLL
jgi:hypothetical protein